MGPPDQLRNYCRGDFWRFVRTFDLVRDQRGRCLELGANPYFTTMLRREFTDLELVLATASALPTPEDRATTRTRSNRRSNTAIKMIAGNNIDDPYSSYGPYGRHNREYNKHELHMLLTYLGFEVEYLDSADVQGNLTHEQIDWNRLIPRRGHLEQADWSRLVPLLRHRERDLGQYLFLRAYNRRQGGTKRPDFLYRSFPANALEPVTAARIGHGA
jgi:hypothetical protein